MAKNVTNILWHNLAKSKITVYICQVCKSGRK